MYQSVDVIWTLLGAAMVFFMQAGFALCEAGMTRAKNTGNIIMKNLMDFCIGTPIYWLIGFGIMFGGTGAIIGGFDPLIRGAYDFGTLPYLLLRYLPDGILRHSCHHRIRCHGRTHQFHSLLSLQCPDLHDRLSDFRTLDLGRRLACAAWLP